jgi:hypothetical protein
MLPPLAPTAAFSFPSYDRYMTGKNTQNLPASKLNSSFFRDFPLIYTTATNLENDGWAHGRERAFQRGDEVVGSWRRRVGSGVGRHGEVVHLVVEQDACAWRQDQGPEVGVDGARHRDGISLAVDNG